MAFTVKLEVMPQRMSPPPSPRVPRCQPVLPPVLLRVPLVDVGACDLRPHLDACFAALESCRMSGTAALVYCDTGCSRAVAVVVAYLVFAMDWPLFAAMNLMVKRCGGIAQARPSPSLRLQLALLEVEKRAVSSVATVSHPLWNFAQWNAVKGSMPVSFVPV